MQSRFHVFVLLDTCAQVTTLISLPSLKKKNTHKTNNTMSVVKKIRQTAWITIPPLFIKDNLNEATVLGILIDFIAKDIGGKKLKKHWQHRHEDCCGGPVTPRASWQGQGS